MRNGFIAALVLPLLAVDQPVWATPLSYGGITVVDVGLTQRVVTDEVSGVALNGYDAVAYFVLGSPRRGDAAYETVWAGAAWRFANAGNLAAFQANPEIYAPRFGGYDAETMARGRAVQGDPTIFAIENGRLYLFRTTANRQAFDRDKGLPAAAQAWEGVEASLVD